MCARLWFPLRITIFLRFKKLDNFLKIATFSSVEGASLQLLVVTQSAHEFRIIFYFSIRSMKFTGQVYCGTEFWLNFINIYMQGIRPLPTPTTNIRNISQKWDSQTNVPSCPANMSSVFDASEKVMKVNWWKNIQILKLFLHVIELRLSCNDKQIMTLFLY